MKYIIATILLILSFNTYSQGVIRDDDCDCGPDSYEVTFINHKVGDSTCKVTAKTIVYDAYRIRMGMYRKPVTGLTNVIAFHWKGYYYYFYAGDANDTSPGFYTYTEAKEKVLKLKKMGYCAYRIRDPLSSVVFR